MKQLLVMSLLLGAIVLAGCSAAALPPATTALPTTAAAATVPATDTTAPTATTPPTIAAAPTGTSAQPATGGSGVPASTYLDDRSTASSLLQSYVNAINRKEYARAYYYWEPGATQLQPFAQFQQGYANTGTVQLAIGAVSGDAGAGQFYSTVPVLLQVQTTNGGAQTFAGCYILHLSNPGIQGTLPFQPLGIRSAKVQQVANGANTANLLAHACDGSPTGSIVPPQPTFVPGDIGATRYLDDRSDPVQVIRSSYNAINRFEYLRAYAYWQPGAAASQLPSLDQFQQGYANTQAVQLTTGTVNSDAGAGNFYYTVPVTLVAQMKNGATQTFVGCYTLHLGNPGMQAAPPFQPLSITSAKINQVANNANTTALLSASCH